MSEKNQVRIEELPWIVFDLHGNTYAINSRLVTGIMMIPEEITPVPDAPNTVRGISQLRGAVIPLIELRHVFQMPSLHEEYTDFCSRIDTRKQDHVTWVNALHAAIYENKPFSLATDPKMCAFGRWYYTHLSNNNNMINAAMKKIEEPHAELHVSATKAIAAMRKGEEGLEEAKNIMHRCQDTLMPSLLKMLDDLKIVFEQSYREMVITLASDMNAKDSTMGIIVDDVKAVESIEMVCDAGELHKIHQNQYIDGVAKNDKYKGEIMVLNEEELLKLGASLNI